MNQLTKQNVPIIITAIVGIVILEAIALTKGMNGTILALSMGAVCALAGGKVGQFLERRKNTKEPS